MSEQYKLIKHLNEGFDLIYDPKYGKNTLVRITDLHKDGLDISLENNPTCYKKSFNINGKNISFPIISIFKRKKYLNDKNQEIDGNPVIYALKKEKGYSFDTSYSKKLLLDRFKTILECVFKNSGNNATVLMPQKNNITRLNGVLVPSYNELNTYIQKAIEEVNPNITFIPKLLRKLNVDEISEICFPPGSYFHRYLQDKLHYTEEESEDAYDTLYDILQTMPNGKYKKHLVKDKDIRNAVGITMEVSSEWMSAAYKENISGKDILLVDDTITYGQTIEEVLNILYDTYTPKSVTILTMFSKKFDN